MNQEMKLWVGGSVLTIVLAVVGTGVAVVGSVNTQISDVRADMRDIRVDIRDVQGHIRDVQGHVRDVQGHVQGVDEGIDAVSSGIDAVNTTLLFLTGCVVELGDRPLLITGGARGDDRLDDPPPLTARIELPQSCRTAHERALRAE